MNHHAILSTVLSTLLALFSQCGASDQDIRTAADYQADLLACVDQATTREESESCRCEVARRYNRPCTTKPDAGAPSP